LNPYEGHQVKHKQVDVLIYTPQLQAKAISPQFLPNLANGDITAPPQMSRTPR
jgi:hypothetical protein